MLRCINCHLCVHRMQRHVMSSLLPTMQTLLATWRSLQQLPPEAVICKECYVILNKHCLNGNIDAERELGHINVCLGCGRSILAVRKYIRHHTLEADDPLIAIIVSWNVDNEVLSRYLNVCHQCWMRASRHQSKDIIRNQSLEQDENFAIHHMHSKIVEDNLIDTNIVKEVCRPEVIEDIQANAKEELRIKSEYPKSPVTDEQMEYQTNDAHIEIIKEEVPCEDSDLDENQSMPEQVYPILQHNTNSEENFFNVDIKIEEVNEDIQDNANEQLQIKSKHAQSSITDEQIEDQFNNTQDEMAIENKIGDNIIDPYFVNENEKSKLFVPEIKVSNVFANVLEINPLECNNFRNRQSTLEQDEFKIPDLKNNLIQKEKKVRQNDANQELNDSTSIVPEIQQEDSQSDSSQESGGCSHVLLKKRKTPADYSREYRARKKALKESQKKSQESEDGSLKSLIIPKTPAKRSREYRAQKRLYMDLEKPIPIAPSTKLVLSNNSRTVDQHSILPDAYFNADIPNARTTSNINNTEDFPDSRIQLHDMLRIQNGIPNKFSKEILTNTDTRKVVPNTEDNEDIKDANEHLQVETEHEGGSICEKEASKVIPESTVNNIYDHILEIKQEVPCEYIDFDNNQSIDCNGLNNDTYLLKDLRIKLQVNGNTSDSQSIPPCANTLPHRVNRERQDTQTNDSSPEEIKEKKRKRNREYQRAWRQRKKDLKKTVSKEEKEEKKRKRHRENQRAYYHRRKCLKENGKNVEELSQKKLDDLQMKRKNLDTNKDQENVVQCRASQILENELEQNQFLTQQLRIYGESHECITPKVILHRNTDIPDDSNCLFHSLIRVLQLEILTCDLKKHLRDSPYLNSCHNPQEAYNILSSNNEYGDLDCLYLFAKVYNQNICVHNHYFNAISKSDDTRFCHFKGNDTHNWIHLDLREQYFTPYFTDDEKKKEEERKRKQKNKEYSKRYRDKKRTLNLQTGPFARDVLDVQTVIHTTQIAGPSTGGVPYIPQVICSSQIADLSSRDTPSSLSIHSNL